MKKLPNKSTEQNIIKALISMSQVSGFPKTIVDVGANHNATISTPFVELGWSALLIEPQKSCIQILSNRFSRYPSVDIVRCGCADVETVLRLYFAKEGEGSELATFSQSNDPWMSMVRDNEHYEEILVKRLSNILLTKPDFSDVGILKIDTESFDYKVILGLEFDKHRPKVIVTEEYLWNVEDVIAKHNLLEHAHYVCIGWEGYNTIWVCMNFFNLSWSEIGLWPWLNKINKTPQHFDCITNFHSITSIINKTHYHDGCLSDLDLLLSAKDIISCPGERFFIPVVISNLGDKSAPSLPDLKSAKKLYLSYHIKSQENYFLWDGLRTPLIEDINPNQSTILQMDFISPNTPGIYDLEIDLVAEGESWYASDSIKRNCFSVSLIVNHTI